VSIAATKWSRKTRYNYIAHNGALTTHISNVDPSGGREQGGNGVLSVEYILPAPVTTENIARMRANKRHIVRGRTVIVSAVDTTVSGAPAVLQEMVIPRNWAYLASVYQKRP